MFQELDELQILMIKERLSVSHQKRRFIARP